MNRSLLLAGLCALLAFGCSDPKSRDRATAAGAHAARAEAALAKNDLRRAISAAELAAAYDPTDPVHRDRLLRVRLTAVATQPELIGRDQIAGLDYEAESMLERDPSHAALYATARGNLALMTGDAASAEKHFREAVAKDGASAGAHLGLGRALQRKGDAAGARAELEAAVKADGALAPALAELGRIVLAAGEVDRALELLKKSASLADSAAVELDLATAYTKKQQAQELGHALSRALELEPRNGEAHRRMAEFLFAANQRDAAKREYATASQLGADPLATFGLARVLFEEKDFGRAAQAFDAVASTGAGVGDALYFAARAHEEGGDAEGAAARYAQFIQAASGVASAKAMVDDAAARLGRARTGAALPPAAGPR